MQTVNLDEAKNRFGKLVDAVEEGEVIVIARNGKPAVKLVPLDYGERSVWSEAVTQFIATGHADPDAFEIDRRDLLPLSERDLF